MSERTAIAVANAPCSYGIFDESSAAEEGAPTGEAVLADVAAGGYDGIDLGPAGFLGDGAALAAALTGHGLSLAGGYVELPFQDGRGFEAALGRLDAVLDRLDAVPRNGATPPPHPTIADAGSVARRAETGRAAAGRANGWGRGEWVRFARGMARVADRCRGRGYAPSFHHHAGTHVEGVWEIEEVLARTDVGLCLDTGHLLVGGGDPLTALRAWLPRVDHVHLKDVRIDVLERVLAESAPVAEVWRRGVFCALGEGDVPVAEIVDLLRDGGYRGWVVVEQDVLPDDRGRRERAARAQPANRRFLRDLGI